MQRNMLLAHKEAILLAMLGDQDPALRAEAVEMIRAVRQRSTSSAEQEIRTYKAPTVNTSAENFRELMDLPVIMECGSDLEPPYTRALSVTELANFKQPASSDRSAAAHAVERPDCQAGNGGSLRRLRHRRCAEQESLPQSAPRAGHKKRWQQE